MALLQSQFDDPDQNDPNAGWTPPPNPYGPGTGGYGPVITPYTPPVTTGGEPPPPAPRGGGGGGGGVGIGNDFPKFEFGAVPRFDAPAFVRPDAKSLLSAPGYQARLQAGEGALQRSAASKGLLRSGGTLKDLIEYGQNFASNEYNNDFNQSLQTYGANYQLAKDKFAPLLAEYDLHSKADIQRALATYNRGTIWNNPNAGGGGGGGYSEAFQQFQG